MKEVSSNISITFDNVLLKPKYSRVSSRHGVNLEMELNGSKFALPIIASPMEITENDMCAAMIASGGFGIIHRYANLLDQIKYIGKVRASEHSGTIGAAVGATDSYMTNALRLVDAGADVILVDVAHGHHNAVGNAIYELRTRYKDAVTIIAGNVSTLEGFKFCENNGAHAVRVGVGGGSQCSTRIVSGHGVPTLQSVYDIYNAGPHEAKIIADGGLRRSGDIAIAFAAGADFCMLGSMLAGTDEAAGEIYESDGKQVKAFRGMASSEAQMAWRGKVSVTEGVSSEVPLKGSVSVVLDQIKQGLGSACSYSGVDNLKDLPETAEFIRIDSSGLQESFPHTNKMV